MCECVVARKQCARDAEMLRKAEFLALMNQQPRVLSLNGLARLNSPLKGYTEAGIDVTEGRPTPSDGSKRSKRSVTG